jgi:hypothetical protein
MEAIVHIAAESGGPMKPRTGADEDASSKPFRPVVPDRSTVIRRNVVVSIGTLWCYSDVDADAHLSDCWWGECRKATSSHDR